MLRTILFFMLYSVGTLFILTMNILWHYSQTKWKLKLDGLRFIIITKYAADILWNQRFAFKKF